MSSSASFSNPQPKASQELQHLQQLFATSLNKDTGSLLPNNSFITQNSNKTMNLQSQFQNPLNTHRTSNPHIPINNETNQFQNQDNTESSHFLVNTSGTNQKGQPSLTLDISDIKEFLMDGPGFNQTSTYPNDNYTRNADQKENIRLLIYLDQPQNNYIFNKNDLASVLNNFSQHTSITIFNERPAAEVSFISRPAANDAIKELDKVQLPHIGLLRCIALNSDQTAHSLVPAHIVDRKNSNRQMAYSGNYNESTKSEGYRAPHSDEVDTNIEQKSQLQKSYLNGPPQLVKKIGWLELIDVFSFEPQFDITEHILGENKANMNYILGKTKEKIGLNIQGKPVNSAPFEERLHLVIFSSDPEAYFKAIQLVEELLTHIMEKLRTFAKENYYSLPETAGFCRHEYEEDSKGRHYLGVIFDSRTSDDHTIPPNSLYQASSRRSRSPQHRRRGASISQRERARMHDNYGTSSSNINVKPLAPRNNSPYSRSSPQRLGGHVGGSKRTSDTNQQMRFNYNRGATGMH